MTALAMKPIHYNRRQVALMVQVAAHFDPDFAGQAGEIIDGSLDPTLTVLNLFSLRAEGEGYVWNPR
jgi:hypothetical protein